MITKFTAIVFVFLTVGSIAYRDIAHSIDFKSLTTLIKGETPQNESSEQSGSENAKEKDETKIPFFPASLIDAEFISGGIHIADHPPCSSAFTEIVGPPPEQA